MSEIWGIPFPTNQGPKTTLFEPTSQLNGKFNGIYLRNKAPYRQSVKCIADYKGSPTLSQIVTNFGPQMASNWTVILPTLYVNSAFYFIARLRRRTPANGTQPNFAKRRMLNRANNLPQNTLGVVP